MEEDKFTEEEMANFERILSNLLDIEVKQEDRDRFYIATSDKRKINRLVQYLESK